ncbi:MAG: 16S rRNA (cytidine(1402)-2'-O)-methyltransferase [Patescibacteria group bacterium]|nr:16S rRNA (cytidine(1402)-2'-O)-methyltransferase [Patescibacteria group bacterium]
MDNKEGKLYTVATPIGNLGDITFRAIDILNSVDLIACEDTRVTRKLLEHYDIDTKTITYHQHTRDDKAQNIINDIVSGKNIAIVTDAGTPGISDPGNKLVALAVTNNLKIEPIPGASAMSAAVSIAGIDMQKFIFVAYPPHKKGRQTFFTRVSESDVPVVYYDSVHRVLKNLHLLQEIAPQIQIILGRELTKMHEEIVRGGIDDVIVYFEENKDKIKGEFVIIAYK